MATDMCSVRLTRLNQLVMEFYKVSNPTRKHLYSSLGYRCARTLERDLKYLREQYGVDIRFTRSTMTYHLEGMGTFLVNLQLSEREVTSLAAGLGMASHFLPHLSKSCENMWAKIQMVIPKTLADQGRKLAGSAVVALPVSRMDTGVFETLIGAISDRRTVRFRYRSPYNGAITLRACVPELGDVARWVMASAPYAEVLEPVLLREQVEQLGEGVAAVHS